MSITETIKQVESQVNLQKLTKEAEKAAIEKTNKEEEEKKLIFIKTESQRVFNKSGVLNLFKEIEDQLLQNFKSHEICEKESSACSHEFGYQNRVISLNWSSNPDLGVMSISAEYNYKSKKLIIIGKDRKTLNRSEWTNEEIVEKVVAEAFVNPSYHSVPTFDYEPYDGGNC